MMASDCPNYWNLNTGIHFLWLPFRVGVKKRKWTKIIGSYSKTSGLRPSNYILWFFYEDNRANAPTQDNHKISNNQPQNPDHVRHPSILREGRGWVKTDNAQHWYIVRFVGVVKAAEWRRTYPDHTGHHRPGFTPTLKEPRTMIASDCPNYWNLNTGIHFWCSL